MKKYALLAAVAVVAAVASFLVLSKGGKPLLGVNDVASDPAAFTGTITVTGIMAGTSKYDPKVFGIMDKKELQCTTPGCNKVYIPVRAAGTPPVPGDEVVLTGSFANEQGGMIFAADKIKVVRNHKIGG